MTTRDPYRAAAERPLEPPGPAASGTTLWAKFRHWFWGLGCSHTGARESSRHAMGDTTTIIHKCSRCGDIVQISWYVGTELDDRWP